MPDTNGRIVALPRQRERLASNQSLDDMISHIMKVIDYDLATPLERVHGSFTVRVIKGKFHSIEGGPSILADNQQMTGRKAS